MAYVVYFTLGKGAALLFGALAIWVTGYSFPRIDATIERIGEVSKAERVRTIRLILLSLPALVVMIVIALQAVVAAFEQS
jgi:hypothetical protein